MNKVEIYNELSEATKGFTKTEFDIILLNHLKEKLEEDIRIEEASAKTGSSKERIKSCLSHIKHHCQNKPILQTCCEDQIDGYQVYTDSYMLVCLTESDKLPIPEYKSKGYAEGLYPNVKNIIQASRYTSGDSDEYVVSDLIAKCKCAEATQRVITNKGYNLFNRQVLSFLKFLNFNPKDTVVLHYQESDTAKMKPIYVENSTTGSYGIILPMHPDNF